MALTDEAIWISNGGHADYGGNEWYRFGLATGQWTRETEPSRLVPAITIPRKDGSSVKLPIPDDGRPLRGHVYGSPVVLTDGRILTINPVPFSQAGVMYFDDYVQNAWLFDPKTLDEVPAQQDIVGLGGCARLGNGNILFGTDLHMQILDPKVSRILDRHGGSLGYACGYDATTRLAVGGAWSPGVAVVELDPTESRVVQRHFVRAPVRLTYAAVLPCGQGVFALVGQDGDIWLFDALRESWQRHSYPSPPSTHQICNKVQWLPGRTAAICVPDKSTEPVHILIPDFVATGS